MEVTQFEQRYPDYAATAEAWLRFDPTREQLLQSLLGGAVALADDCSDELPSEVKNLICSTASAGEIRAAEGRHYGRKRM